MKGQMHRDCSQAVAMERTFINEENLIVERENLGFYKTRELLGKRRSGQKSGPLQSVLSLNTKVSQKGGGAIGRGSFPRAQGSDKVQHGQSTDCQVFLKKVLLIKAFT